MQIELARAGADLSKPCGGYYCDVRDDGTLAHCDCSIACLRRRESELLCNWPNWLRQALGHLAADVGISARGGKDFGASLYDRNAGELGHFDCSFSRGFVGELRAPLAFLQQYLLAIMETCPITHLRATDKTPWPQNAKERRWLRSPTTFGPQRAGADEWMAALLPQELRDTLDPGGPAEYDSVELAHAALSEAILALYRRVIARPQSS